MAVNKNFVVKNGLEVNTNLIFAEASTNKVGIASTAPRTELDVRGGIAATDFYLSGIGTFANELNVGTDGSVLTALGIGGSVGIGTALPEYLLDVRSPVSTGQTALYVYGDLEVTGDLQVDDISFDQANINNLNVTGVSTLGTVQVSSGIVTATTGIVTYYGDGSQLDGVIGGIGINTEGGLVGFGVTYLHLFGAGVSTTFYDQTVGIATIYLQGGGGGGGSVSISSVAPSLPENGDLWYSIDYGRTFVYYDETVLGIGSTAVWVDAAPFNIGVIDIEDLTVGSLTVTNNASITGLAITNLTVTNINATGIITAVDFNSTSDATLKENVLTVENALETVEKLRGVSFDWKENHKPSYGVIAQELEEVLPALVSDTEIKTVNYNGIIGVLIEAVKELSQEVRELKGQN